MSRKKSRNNGEITFLHSITNYKEQDFLNPSFETLLKFMTLDDDQKFLDKLIDLEYYEEVMENYRSFLQIMSNQLWESLIRRPHYLFFLLRGVRRKNKTEYEDVIDILKIFELKNDLVYHTVTDKLGLSTYKVPRKIQKMDFENASEAIALGINRSYGIDDIPNEVFHKLAKKLRKGIYDIKKPFLPVYTFAKYKRGSIGKTAQNMISHCGYIALDFDQEFKDETKAIALLNEAFDVVAILRSPSGIIRPILRIDLSDTTLINFGEMHVNRYPSDLSNINKYDTSPANFPSIKNELIFNYHKIVFKKIAAICKAIKLGVPLDIKTGTANRVWYFARNVNGLVQDVNIHAQPIRLSKSDIIKYGNRTDFNSVIGIRGSLLSLSHPSQNGSNLKKS